LSSDSPQQKADRGCLLFIRQHLDVSQPCCIVDGHMGLLITRTTGRAQASVTRDPVTHSLKASELLGIYVNHVAGPGPLITVYRLSWLQVLESAEAQGLEHPTDGGEWRRQYPGDATQGAALMAEVNRALQLQWIERPPLVAANTPSIHQC
jgi:hypothetical protein